MSINVNTNVSAMTAQRYTNSAVKNVAVSMERLSSGNRINSAKDDAAGMQISNKLTAQSRGLDIAVRNANDAISISQTAEGAMTESTSILQRMRDLAIQSSNGSNGLTERKAIQQEIGALNKELNRIAETTAFGGTRLLNGTFGSQSFQIGSNAGEAVVVRMSNMRSDTAAMGGDVYAAEEAKSADWKVEEDATLELSYTTVHGKEVELTINAKVGDDIEELATYVNGQTDDLVASVGEDGKFQIYASTQNVNGEVNIGGSLASEIGFGDATRITVNDLDVSTVAGSQQAISLLDGALKNIDSERSYLGALQNRMDHAISNLSNINEKVNASNSRIKDTDFAKETTALTKSQVLQQSSQSILAQAKQSPQAALSLLG